MTGWDILEKIMSNFSPIAAATLVTAAAVIFILGFSRRGLNFIKYGFGKMALDDTLEKRFDRLEERLDKVDARLDKVETRLDGMDSRLDGMGARLDGVDSRITAIETNHFGHLKNYLGILNGVLLKNKIIDDETKALLDNELRWM
jgi:hypothetical protein